MNDRAQLHRFDMAMLARIAHRPWPMPASPWVMTQTWHDLLFAHWRFDPERLRSLVPRQLELDLFDGVAWVGIVPFRMTNVGPRGLPRLPWISAFPELNVRTYVRIDDRPGVYFFSLDAGNSLAVRTARALLNLPYHLASMRVADRDGAIEYDSRRGGGGEAELSARYRPTGAPFTASPGSLEYFLTERYCLYHLDRGGAPYRLEIHHGPWELQPAEGRFLRNTMAEANGFVLPSIPPLLHFSRRQDAVAWPPKRTTGGAAT
jgi:uncharacterized protein YqjF (DUF2071 family)